MKDDSDDLMNAKVIPYLAIKGASQAIDFYRAAFGAVEVFRLEDEEGKISHAEIRISGATVLISDEYPEIGVRGPQSLGGSAVMIVLEVADVDHVFHQAIEAGARLERSLQDSFDGELRNGKLIDPYGHRWMVLTRKKKT